jgi:hypothetical protein
MSFLDTLSGMNPFKKKDDFAFPPMDNSQQDFSQPGLDNNSQFGNPQQFDNSHMNQGNYDFQQPHQQSQQPLNDQRMTMPLGENIRQGRVSGMYGEDSAHEVHESRDHNPMQKDMDLLSSKLDYLRLSLDSINQRLANLEHLVRSEMEKKKW